MIFAYEGQQLYYEVHGTGVPLVMLHGYRVDHRIMTDCMEPLFDGPRALPFCRVYLDLPGMGESSAPSWLRNADDMLDILIACINEVVGFGPFAIASESYGGYLARGLARKLSSRILGILFIAPCIFPDRSKRTLPKFYVCTRQGMDSFQDHRDYDSFCSVMAVQTPATWTAYQKSIMSGIRQGNRPFLDSFATNGYQFSFQIDHLGMPYLFPTLFVTGRQDNVVGYADAFSILGDYSSGTFAVLEGAAHNVQVDQRKEFEQLASHWLAAVYDHAPMTCTETVR